jgi:hypothetical protein
MEFWWSMRKKQFDFWKCFTSIAIIVVLVCNIVPWMDPTIFSWICLDVFFFPWETIKHNLEIRTSFSMFFYWFHINLFHSLTPTLFWVSNLFSYNFSSSIILVVSSLVGFAYMWSPLIAIRTYFVSIRGCKP